MKRKVKVYKDTWIMVDSPLSDQEIREKWQEKNRNRKPLTEEQIRRERVSIREGRISQRKGYK